MLDGYIMTLHNLGGLKMAVNEPEQARVSFENVISILKPLATSFPKFRKSLQDSQNALDELKRKEGIRTGALRELAASDTRFLPEHDPLTPVKRAIVKLLPTFGGDKSGIPSDLGTGFVVKREGSRAWIATVLHVLLDKYNAPPTKVVAELFTGALPAGLVAPRLEVVFNPQDLKKSSDTSFDEPILLEVRGLPPDIQPLTLATVPAKNELTIIGHPISIGPWSLVRFPLLPTKTQGVLLLEGELTEGASGSPVLSASQQVVGIVYDSPETSKKRPIPQTFAFPVKVLADKMGR